MRQSLVSIGFRVSAFPCIASISLHRGSVKRAATAVDGRGPNNETKTGESLRAFG